MHAMVVAGNSGRCLPNQPHQPLTFTFPKREFRKKVVCKRSFQVSWFSKWSWLHYVEDKNVVLCYTCAHAYSEKNFSGLLIMIWHLFQKVTTTGRMLLLSLIYILLATVTKKHLLQC